MARLPGLPRVRRQPAKAAAWRKWAPRSFCIPLARCECAPPNHQANALIKASSARAASSRHGVARCLFLDPLSRFLPAPPPPSPSLTRQQKPTQQPQQVHITRPTFLNSDFRPPARSPCVSSAQLFIQFNPTCSRLRASSGVCARARARALAPTGSGTKRAPCSRASEGTSLPMAKSGHHFALRAPGHEFAYHLLEPQFQCQRA